MPSIETSALPSALKAECASADLVTDWDLLGQAVGRSNPPFRLFHDLSVEGPALRQVYVANGAGLCVGGLIESVFARGLHLLTPVRVPPQRNVSVTVAGCCTLPADAVYCVSQSQSFRMGIAFRKELKPEIVVGAFAVIRETTRPFHVTKGHVLDVGNNSLSILCKTTLKPRAGVRVESNGWVLFGEVDLVVLSTMITSCVLVHLDTAFQAQFEEPAREASSIELEGSNKRL